MVSAFPRPATRSIGTAGASVKTSLVLFEVKAFFDVNSGREEQPPDGRETGTPLLRGGENGG